jgi:predicted nucleotidyltransferase
LRTSINTLIPSDSYLILQYGSSLFGSETKESDFDIIILCSYNTLASYQKRAANKAWASIRDLFLFEDMLSILQRDYSFEILKVFEVKNAKVPILKIKYRDQLNLDVSLGIVNNEVIDASLPISMMNPHDQETESVIQAVLICQEIQRQVQQAELPLDLFS